MVSTSNILTYFYFSFSPCILIFSDWSILFLPSFVVLRFSLLAWFIVICQILSLCPDCIFSLYVLGFPILSLFGKQFDVIHMFGEWFLLNFPSMALSVIIAVKNRNVDSIFHLKIPLSIFTSAKLPSLQLLIIIKLFFSSESFSHQR